MSEKGLGRGVLPGTDALLILLGCQVVPVSWECTDNQTYSLPRRLEVDCQGVNRVGFSLGLAPGLLMITGPRVPHTFLFDLIGLFKEDARFPVGLTLTCSPL